MEELTTRSIKVKGLNGQGEYLLKEKDYGDLVVYDVYFKSHYLLTLSKEGSILFMNFDADPAEKEIFKLSHLNQFVEAIKEIS